MVSARLIRATLDVMRTARDLLTVAEIVDRMLAINGATGARTDQICGLQSAMLASLRNRKSRHGIGWGGAGRNLGFIE
jgi:hypothetical protein